MKLFSGKNKRFFTALIALHALFFLWQIQQQNYLLQDSVEYLTAAENLLSDAVLYAGNLNEDIDPSLYTKRPPGYPVFLALFKLLQLPVEVILLIQNILSILSIALARKLFIKLGYQTRYDSLLLLLLLLAPGHFIYPNMLMAESLIQFFLVTMLWCFHSFTVSKKWKWLILLNLLLGIAMLVKPVMYLWAVPNALILLVVSYRKVQLAPLLIALLIPFLAMASWMIRNHEKTGSYQFSSIQQINLVYYNANYFNIKMRGTEAATLEIDSLTSHTESLPYPQKWKERQNWAFSKISTQPVSYFFFHLSGMAGFFIDPGRFDLVQFLELKMKEGIGLLHHLNESGIQGTWNYLKQQPELTLVLILIAGVNAIRFLLAAIYIYKTPRKSPSLWYIVLLTGYLALATGPLGASRFAVPVVPFLILMAICGLQYLKRPQNSLLRKAKTTS